MRIVIRKYYSFSNRDILLLLQTQNIVTGKKAKLAANQMIDCLFFLPLIRSLIDFSSIIYIEKSVNICP